MYRLYVFGKDDRMTPGSEKAAHSVDRVFSFFICLHAFAILRSLVTVLHTNVQTMLKCIRKQTLITLYYVVERVKAFALTDHDRPD